MEKELIKRHVESIRRTASEIDRQITVMEICGGHTNVIMQYGIRSILPSNIRLISGPGCPVCVSSQKDIDSVIELAENGIPIATYGDMLRVPGTKKSLEEARAKGAKVFEVYSASEALEISQNNPSVVFFGVGFETTAPMTGFLLENEICVYSVHKLVPPAIGALVGGEMRIDGFLNPGHVSTISGLEEYRKIRIPQVVSGFTPERILRALSILIELIRDNRQIVVNGYPEAVREEGNRKAQRLLEKEFVVSDSVWRGLGSIPLSGLEVRNKELNAKIKYSKILANVPPPKKSACRCGEVLKGILEPSGCPLYKRTCTPDHPHGPCMVSSEGSCAIAFRYREGTGGEK